MAQCSRYGHTRHRRGSRRFPAVLADTQQAVPGNRSLGSAYLIEK
jgi:hypothetical protein